MSFLNPLRMLVCYRTWDPTCFFSAVRSTFYFSLVSSRSWSWVSSQCHLKPNRSIIWLSFKDVLFKMIGTLHKIKPKWTYQNKCTGKHSHDFFCETCFEMNNTHTNWFPVMCDMFGGTWFTGWRLGSLLRNSDQCFVNNLLVYLESWGFIVQLKAL